MAGMPAGSETLPAETAPGRVALSVPDLDREREFYRDVLGLSVRDRAADRVVVGTDERALLILRDQPDRAARAPDETGLFHVAIRLPTRDALGDALRRVSDRWELTGASDHLVSEALYLDDPAGNGLELYWDRPQAEWPIDQDGHVAMDTRPLDLAALRGLGSDRPQVPAGTDVGHVHLEVSSIAATEQFYTEGLGFRVRQTYGDEAIFLAAGDYHHHVGANVWNGRTARATGLGLDWFEIRVPDEPALDDTRRRVEDLGHAPTDTDDGFAVADPDGIELRVSVGTI